MWPKLLAVAAGGLAGTLLRYTAYTSIDPADSVFPWATVFVNLIGSFLLAVVAAAIRHSVIRSEIGQIGLSAGFLASFTTFSNFTLDILILLEETTIIITAGYVALSVFGGGIFAYAGWKGAGFINRNRVT